MRAVSDGRGVINLCTSPVHPTWALGVLGMPGLTAYAGLTQIGQPKEGETLVEPLSHRSPQGVGNPGGLVVDARIPTRRQLSPKLVAFIDLIPKPMDVCPAGARGVGGPQRTGGQFCPLRPHGEPVMNAGAAGLLLATPREHGQQHLHRKMEAVSR